LAPPTKTLYGIISLLIALLVISSTLTAYYYTEYSQASANNSKIETELQSATTKYSALAAEYNGVLSTYNGSISSFETLASVYNSSSASFLSVSKVFNTTFTLLVSAVSELNTSDGAYVTASSMLTELWNQYLSITAQYKQESSSFQTVLTSFESKNNLTLHENITPISISLLTSDILIDFGNGTNDWFNDTSVQPRWNLYVATLVITSGNVNATYYPEYAEHLVTGIDDVLNSNSEYGPFWFLWTYNSTTSWQVAQVGPDLLPMYNGSIYAWTYCSADSNFNPTCKPP
jgi:hypothetical protein